MDQIEHDKLIEALSSIDLEIPCDGCKGRGYRHYHGHPDRSRCSNCNGSGYEPTEFGEKIVALMAHHFRPMLKDAKND